MSSENGQNKSGIEIIPDLKNLRSYAQIKMALGDLLRVTHQGFITLRRKEPEDQCQGLLVKLAEDRFTLAVLGQFKRGKSSLMNAIIGEEILPTGVLPLTSAITILRYGPKERLIIEKENSLFPAELPVTDLPNYVTEKGNPQNQKKVKAAYLELPVPFLRYGLEFVDTPGIGSAIAANTETTYNFLPSCDAALFVTSVDTPMTTAEVEFLNTIKEYVHKIFFIVNKIDLVADKERKDILEFVAQTVQSNVGIEMDKVFPISCQAALAARATGKADLYEASGLKLLEDALALFLTEEKSATLLAAIAQKAGRIIDNEKTHGAFTETYLEERSAAILAEKVRSIHENPHDAALEITKARTNFSDLYHYIVTKEAKISTGFDMGTPVNLNVEQESVTVDTLQSKEPAKEIDLQADLQVRGCPVCEHITDQAFDFFAHWQYQIATNEQAQASFASGIAFCPLHTWQLQSMSSPQGASIGYARLAEEIAHRLKADDAMKGEQMRKLIHNFTNCPVCKYLHEAEQQYVLQLLESLKEPEGMNRYRRSNGSCLYHLSLMLDNAPPEELRNFLLHHAIEKFEQDAEDMRSFALKNVALRRFLQNENEKDAYRRTIIRIVGERSVCTPWTQDGTV
jgi:small GTP-binding protein